jgi:ribose-phosphate pyrophosphokinase
MVETLRQLKARGYTHMACVVVHGIFAGDAYRSLWDAGAAQVVSCNTVPHESNAIDVTPLLADAIASLTERKGAHLGPRGGRL